MCIIVSFPWHPEACCVASICAQNPQFSRRFVEAMRVKDSFKRDAFFSPRLQCRRGFSAAQGGRRGVSFNLPAGVPEKHAAVSLRNLVCKLHCSLVFSGWAALCCFQPSLGRCRPPHGLRRFVHLLQLCLSSGGQASAAFLFPLWGGGKCRVQPKLLHLPPPPWIGRVQERFRSPRASRAACAAGQARLCLVVQPQPFPSPFRFKPQPFRFKP